MDKINEIFLNEKYNIYLKELEEFERDRIFCKHNIEHFLDVSRIAYIKVLEKNINISKNVIYAIGLLHDIGRVLEYKNEIDHHMGSVIIAKEILSETSYTKEEIEVILKGIENHRKDKDLDELSKIIYLSDKESRRCFFCKASDECYWSIEKRNLKIKN